MQNLKPTEGADIELKTQPFVLEFLYFDETV